MHFNWTRRNTEHSPADDYRARLIDLEAAQRRDPYAAGRGDGPRRQRRGRAKSPARTPARG